MSDIYQKVTTILGIDYGDSFIGTALGRGEAVAPLATLPGKDVNTAINTLARLAVESKIDFFVVGLPLTVDNKETKQSLETRKFAKLLKIRTKKPVKFYNEYATSTDALEEAIESGIRKKKRLHNDSLAAALILKRFTQEQVSGK